MSELRSGATQALAPGHLVGAARVSLHPADWQLGEGWGIEVVGSGYGGQWPWARHGVGGVWSWEL